MGKFKRLLTISLLIFSLLLVGSSNAGWNPYILKTEFGQIADSTGSTYNYGDFTATNAFFWSSLDLSPYAGPVLGSTPYSIEVVDAGGKKATGYLAGVGAGKTLGSELVVNGNFASAEPPGTAWNRGAGWTIAGGVLVATSVDVGIQVYQNLSHNIGLELFEGNLTVLNYIAGTANWIVAGVIRIHEIDGDGDYIGYGNSDASGNYASVMADTTFTAQIDNYSVKRVTDPPNTAVHIVSSLNGTTRNWASIESGFNPNNIASWKIYRL